MAKNKSDMQQGKDEKSAEQAGPSEQTSTTPEITTPPEVPGDATDAGNVPPEGQQSPPEGGPDNSTGTTAPPEEPKEEKPELESLPVLADRHRVPTWQQAALCRLMGWEDGKMVSNADYLDGLDRLKTRRLGGGRMG